MMLIKAVRAASGRRYVISKGLLRTANLSPICSIKQLGHGKARISIFVGRFSPAPVSRELSNPNIISKLARQDYIPPGSGYELIYRANLPLYLVLTQGVLAVAAVGVVALLIGNLIVTDNQKSDDADSSDAAIDSSVNSNLSKDTTTAKVNNDMNSDKDDLPNPNPKDFNPDDMELLALLVFSLAVLMITMFRLQNMTPTRIYTKPSKHCIAVFYGSVIPGKVTHHEFLAGTLKSLKSKSVLSENIYKDGSGKKMILMDYYFRYPADLNRLLGKGYDKL